MAARLACLTGRSPSGPAVSPLRPPLCLRASPSSSPARCGRGHSTPGHRPPAPLRPVPCEAPKKTCLGVTFPVFFPDAPGAGGSSVKPRGCARPRGGPAGRTRTPLARLPGERLPPASLAPGRRGRVRAPCPPPSHSLCPQALQTSYKPLVLSWKCSPPGSGPPGRSLSDPCLDLCPSRPLETRASSSVLTLPSGPRALGSRALRGPQPPPPQPVLRPDRAPGQHPQAPLPAGRMMEAPLHTS